MQRCANNLVKNTLKRYRQLGSLSSLNSLSLNSECNAFNSSISKSKYVTKAAQEPFLNGSSSKFDIKLLLLDTKFICFTFSLNL